MRYRFLASMGALVVVIAFLSLAPVPVMGPTSVESFVGVAEASGGGAQAPPDAAKKANTWTPPRTSDGRPDLQGVWDFRTITPLERASDLGGKQFLTDEEAAQVEAKAAEDRIDRPPRAGDPGTYNQFWFDRGTRVVEDKRSALIVDPPDGKIPPLTPEGQKRKAAGGRQALPAGPEDRNVAERCILGFNSGPPMEPRAYNNNVQVFQTPGYVVILNEMVHDTRIVPLDGRPHGTIRQWTGDSRGRWDGDTLVIDTTNFYNKTAFSERQGSTPNMHLVERFTRVDSDTLLYEFTVDDPATWTRPWTAAIPMTKSEERIYEYACHEGNYGMFGILTGARAQEKAAEDAAKKGSR
jgi:hypothetical protein